MYVSLPRPSTLAHTHTIIIIIQTLSQLCKLKYGTICKDGHIKYYTKAANCLPSNWVDNDVLQDGVGAPRVGIGIDVG